MTKEKTCCSCKKGRTVLAMKAEGKKTKVVKVNCWCSCHENKTFEERFNYEFVNFPKTPTTSWDNIKSFFKTELASVLDKLMLEDNIDYDVNDLKSASDYYNIRAHSWTEITRLECGLDMARERLETKKSEIRKEYL